ncbi:hypothetical protein HBI56_219920 [Parastagonospora nodorum]|uniref:Trichothecene 3-O-acetyltransferase n=1 Tax=Phaeosphaeria nodorum (strain SN15 / ATCC MYA-4574 / FGSC 10173) TaxID=321614 RepID=A0A7U2EPC4_PHANO|nr:hypothetical protein HBH56_007070 [Parastagonospora nodorum]QRC90516.1 hypothetical protein JI435_425540 [Parastagonospora nodorum SN15]KAH3922120.1 hypothetical protein HBH54_228710 [Parastagonospora nodorum]KAH3940257.1 hypothetical protein HBH53_220130 [Parastagonospora nodorum]KAH3960032.1 hypothetical protein HBH52_238980 [Parastagonospora nodorum]
MPRIEKYNVHPLGWENDPEEERFRLSTLDYLSSTTYTNTALFFKVADPADLITSKVATILKEGLERCLSQIRHMNGKIERDEDGHHSIVKRRNSTVRFVVQYLDGPEDAFPSFAEIENVHFMSSILGNVDVLSNLPMTCGNKPEAHPDNSPPVSSFKANFIRGGLILNLMHHHWNNGLTGGTAFNKQLAMNCYAVANKLEPPFWDPKWLDRSLYGLPGFENSSASDKPPVDAPPRAQKNLQIKPSQSLVFHLRKSKAVELKRAASPSDGSRISTYSAVCALMWRVLTRIREPLYKPDPSYAPLWAQGVTIGKLYNNPPLPGQLQGNLQFDVTSETSGLPKMTVADIISPNVPLSKLARYTRNMTESVTHDMLSDQLAKFASVRNKQDLSINVDSFPPMAMLIADWRYSDVCKFNWGFGEPTAYRHLFGGVPLCMVIVFPAHKGPAGDDEGMELQITFETELVPILIHDPDWSKYFEFRGVDLSDEQSLNMTKSKL